MSDIQKIIEFYRIVEKLGLVKRDVKLSDGSYESDSSHILKTAYMVFSVAPYLQTKVNVTRMLELALVHDLAEAECGDIPLCAQIDNSALKERKKRNELAAIKHCCSLLPEHAGNKIFNLFTEYEEKNSREAKIVYVLDKLEANYQACRFGNVRYWGEGKGGDWYYQSVMSGNTPEKDVLAQLNEPLLNHLEAQCLSICRLAVKKSGIHVEEVPSALNYIRLPLTASLVDFIDLVEKLAMVERDNRLSEGTQETDADHIVKLCYLLLVLTPFFNNPVDNGRLLRLALVHDLPEAISGDISLSAQMENPKLRQSKKEQEAEAVAVIRQMLPAPLNQQIHELYGEYQLQETREARLVKLLDKLEGTLQSNLYHDGDIRYWKECEGGSWYYHHALQFNPLLNDLDEPVLNDLQKEIIRLSRQNMLKFGIMQPADTAAQNHNHDLTDEKLIRGSTNE